MAPDMPNLNSFAELGCGEGLSRALCVIGSGNRFSRVLQPTTRSRQRTPENAARSERARQRLSRISHHIAPRIVVAGPGREKRGLGAKLQHVLREVR